MTDVNEPYDLVDFTPVKNFYCNENQTSYMAGLGYTATNDVLKNLVEQWVAQGLVVLGRPSSKLAGIGEVR